VTHEKNVRDKPFRLQDLMLNFDKIPEAVRKENTFRVNFCVYRIDPADARELIVAACPKCHATTSCRDLGADGAFKCPKCKVDTKLIYQM